MKTVQNPTVLMETQKNRKLLIFVNCLKFFSETLEQIVTKSHKILFLNGKEDK